MSAHKLHRATAGHRRARVALWLTLAAATLVNTPLPADTAGMFAPATLDTTDGRQIFEQICQGCHMSGGRGAAGAGQFPALAHNRTLASGQYVALTILLGRRNMPAFGAKHAIFDGPAAILSETQIAAVTNYIRTHFGNRYTKQVTAAEVVALDQSVR